MSNWKLHEGPLPVGWSCFLTGHRSNTSKSPSYISWYSMVQRCYSAYKKKEPRNAYNRRLDLKVCRRWIEGHQGIHGFLIFLQDMGERPDGLTLDRINPSLGYTPSNCRWADASTQARNKLAC